VAAITDPDFDILSAIFHLLALSKITWMPIHVKSHQLNIHLREDLTQLVLLHIGMKKLIYLIILSACSTLGRDQ
jgi:hypothetical protein